jgi:hypothetical protein
MLIVVRQRIGKEARPDWRPRTPPQRERPPMFEREIRDNPARSVGAMLELTFHAAVRNVRKSSGNPVVGLVVNILQSVILIAVFLVMFELIGTGRPRIHGGDTVLFVMSGVMMFMAHVKAMGAVAGSDGPTSPMMKHSPMNQVVAIWSAALSALYLQVLSAVVILFLYHAVWTPITIHQPVEALGMLILSWLSGVALGMVVQAARPWWPAGVGLMQSVYARMNMIFSGKMFVANLMPGYVIAFFD